VGLLGWTNCTKIAEHRAKKRVARSAPEIVPTEEELDKDVIRKLRVSDMYYFVNVPDVKLPSTSAEAAVVAERNEAYAEVLTRV